MNSTVLLERNTNAVNPKNLIGTRWISRHEISGARTTVEFVDESTCIYATNPRKFPTTYTVKDGKIFINHIKLPFELKGQMLFNNGIPAFEKSA